MTNPILKPWKWGFDLYAGKYGYLSCTVPVKWKIIAAYLKAFSKKGCFPFWNLFFHFRDNDVSALCKLDKWWRHEVCNLRSFHYSSIALCIPYCTQFHTWLVHTLENSSLFFMAGPRYRSKSSFLRKTSVVTLMVLFTRIYRVQTRCCCSRCRQDLDWITDRITDLITDWIVDWITDRVTDWIQIGSRIGSQKKIKEIQKDQIIYKMIINKK